MSWALIPANVQAGFGVFYASFVIVTRRRTGFSPRWLRGPRPTTSAMWWSAGWLIFAGYWVLIPRLQLANLGVLGYVLGGPTVAAMMVAWLRAFYQSRSRSR